ncbi:DUF6529 family protein [Planotetraspora phitsanulokensis]|uniref:Uncharacterized protein n=1 Tax=Planotetraspora phitsanulokensis TaxID=575192 RepID=A0A8J3XEU0_9ACTN|nr:DUF6529 family protein [Planotetraspora phitsanulokensis]GII38164.1 hypothetical protein Pph01_31670 [Planotetraspora phitsanulokensis]
MSPRPAWLRLATAAGLAVAVTVALYAFGRIHTLDYASSLFGRRGDDANLLKAQVGTALLGLAVYQLILALWIYQRLPGAGAAPRPVHLAHRIGGAVLFVLSLPIAYHCITAYGVQTYSARVALHALSGCFFYGAFAAKVLIVRSRHLPGWALPLAGGTLFTLIALLWSSGALWQLAQP